jgi:hypothetical protein
MEGPEIPIQDDAITARQADQHARLRPVEPHIGGRHGVRAHCQNLAKPRLTVAFEDDVSTRLHQQLVQGRLERKLAPIHRAGQRQDAALQLTASPPVLVYTVGQRPCERPRLSCRTRQLIGHAYALLACLLARRPTTPPSAPSRRFVGRPLLHDARSGPRPSHTRRVRSGLGRETYP